MTFVEPYTSTQLLDSLVLNRINHIQTFDNHLLTSFKRHNESNVHWSSVCYSSSLKGKLPARRLTADSQGVRWPGTEVRRWCNDETLTSYFKQVAMDSLSRFYLYSFNSLHEQFYNQIYFLKFLTVVTLIASSSPYLIPLLFPNFPTGNPYLFDL